MEKNEILKELTELILDKFGVDSIISSDSFKDDLGLDSLDLVELLLETEKTFNIRFQDKQYDTIMDKTVDDLINMVYELTKNK